MWQPQWAATIWKIAGSAVSIKLLSASSAFCDKPLSVLRRAVMALLFFVALNNSYLSSNNLKTIFKCNFFHLFITEYTKLDFF